VAWLTYAAYYLGRVNISTAMPDMQLDLALSKSQVGLISTGFFWAYALGQLLNGQLGDRVSPRRFIFVGMLASAGLNLIFGSLAVWPAMLMVWTINGYCQSTGWGPILRTLANWLTPSQRRKVAGIFGSCFVAGNAFTWLLTGWLVARFGWRLAFWAPAGLLILMALGWYLIIRDTPEAAGHEPVQPAGSGPELPQPRSLPVIRGLWHSFRRFWPLTAAAVFLGFCLISLMVWLPTYYVEAGQLEIGLASTLATLIPFSGIAGTLLVGWLVGQYLTGQEALGLAVALLALAGLFFLYPTLPLNLATSSIMLMVIGGVVYGASSLLLATMPLALGEREEASGTAGLVDFAFNIGAGLSGGVVGAILETQSWTFVFLALGGAALLAACFMGITILRMRR
jgi:OPA family glycerol-3-phosphate transporter-like MFS transporter